MDIYSPRTAYEPWTKSLKAVEYFKSASGKPFYTFGVSHWSYLPCFLLHISTHVASTLFAYKSSYNGHNQIEQEKE